MAGGARKTADDALVAALAGGSSVQAAAQLATVSERTVYRRLRDRSFRQKVAQARAEAVQRAVGHLAAAAVDAAVVLRTLAAQSKDERVKLRAAVAVLELGTKLRESVELEERLQALEERIKRVGDEQCLSNPD